MTTRRLSPVLAVYAEPQLRAWVFAQAQQEGLTASAWVRRLIIRQRRELERQTAAGQ